MQMPVAIIACIMLSLFNIAKAQTTPITSMAARIKAAEEMLVVTKAGEQYQRNIDTTLTQMAASAPDDKRAKFISVMKTFNAKYCSWDVMKAHICMLYAHEFTEAELKQLTAFYKSPLAQKLYQKQPLIFQATSALTQKALAEHQTELNQLMADAMK